MSLLGTAELSIMLITGLLSHGEKPAFKVIEISQPKGVFGVGLAPGGRVILQAVDWTRQPIKVSSVFWRNGTITPVLAGGNHGLDIYRGGGTPPPMVVLCADSRGNYGGYDFWGGGGIEDWWHLACVHRSGRTTFYPSKEKGCQHSEITGISENGKMVGIYSQSVVGDPGYVLENKGFVIEGGKIRTVGHVKRLFVNAQGMVVGYYRSDRTGKPEVITSRGDPQRFKWFVIEKGKPTVKGNGFVVDLTDDGRVVGWTPQDPTKKEVPGELFTWKNGIRRVVPSHPLKIVGAVAANSRGEVLGADAKGRMVLYVSGRWKLLSTLVKLPKGTLSWGGIDIDNDGNLLISGYSRDIVKNYFLKRIR
jgi:hypothetical protein